MLLSTKWSAVSLQPMLLYVRLASLKSYYGEPTTKVDMNLLCLLFNIVLSLKKQDHVRRLSSNQKICKEEIVST